MKQFLKIAIAAIFLILGSGQAKAQKVAHFSMDSILAIMPEMKKAREDAQAYYKTLETQLTKMQIELERKYAEYDSLKDKISPLIKAIKEKEINDQQTSIQAFQQNAQSEYANYLDGLVKPIFDKIYNAARDVAKAKGYKYVLDSSKSKEIVIYADPLDDIFEDVRIKLGIPKPAAPAPAPGGGPAPK